MANDTHDPFLSDDEVLALPLYAEAARQGCNAKNLLTRHRLYGLLTPAPNQHRVKLRAFRLGGRGFAYRRSDVDAFFAAINGQITAAPDNDGYPTAAEIHGHGADAAMRELEAAGLA